jgi:hypothetical protein
MPGAAVSESLHSTSLDSFAEHLGRAFALPSGNGKLPGLAKGNQFRSTFESVLKIENVSIHSIFESSETSSSRRSGNNQFNIETLNDYQLSIFHF